MALSGQPNGLLGRMACWTLVTLAAVMVVISFIPQISSSDWWLIRVFDFPRLQIGLVSLAVGLGLLPFLSARRKMSAANVACVGTFAAAVLQATYIAPYLPVSPKQVPDAEPGVTGPELTLFIANVLMDHHDPVPIRTQIEQSDADIVLLTEPDVWWQSHLSSLDTAYRYRVEVPLDNTYGMLLYSRLPLISPEVEYLVDPDTPSIHTAIELGGQRVALRFTHPKPPAPAEAKQTTHRDGELLLVARAVEREGGPAIIAGDLNTVPWSEAAKLLQRTAGVLDPRQGRGLYATFPADHPLLRWPLDQLFQSEHFSLVRLERLGDNGSDHFPLLITLRLTPTAPAPETPDLDADDARKVQEKIQDARTEPNP